MSEKYFSAKHLSENLDINLFTIYAWVRKGILPAVKVGPKLVRIKESDVEKIISSQGTPGHGESAD